MHRLSTDALEDALNSLALGEEIKVQMSGPESLSWRVVNTRQGWQSFVDVSQGGHRAHFECMTATPQAPRKIAGAVLDGQLEGFLAHPATRIACIGDTGEFVDGLPIPWKRQLGPNDVSLTWIDGPAPEFGVRMQIDINTWADLRLIDGAVCIWLREEIQHENALVVREREGQLTHVGSLSRIRRAPTFGQLSEGCYADVDVWTFSGGDREVVVERRRGWRATR
ncbi:MAG: hypothetical protein R3E66_12290 [bacterium]